MANRVQVVTVVVLDAVNLGDVSIRVGAVGVMVEGSSKIYLNLADIAKLQQNAVLDVTLDRLVKAGATLSFSKPIEIVVG